MTLDLLIRGGTVFDGVSEAGRLCDVGVRGDRIVLPPVPSSSGREPQASASSFPPDTRAARVIDAALRYVMPGFIDIHSHSDFNWLIWPNATSKLLAGVTTDVSGNCGYGAFPLAGEVLARRQADHQKWNLCVDWPDAAGYFARLDETPCAVNRAVLIGHGNLRGVAVGYDNRPAGAAEMAHMRRLCEAGMEAGAFGLSSGLVYAPGCWASVDELADLATVVREHGGFYTSHVRSEGESLIEAVDEFLEVLGLSRCRGQLSHVKTLGKANWAKLGVLYDRLSAALADGVELMADRYPYLATNTSLMSMLLPTWAVEGSAEQIIARLRDPGERARIRQAILDRPDADGLLSDVWVTSFAHDGFEELSACSLVRIGAIRDQHPVDAALDLLVEDELGPEAIHFAMSDANLAEILGWPFVNVGSDAGARDALVPGEHCHPRAFGTPAAFLATYVREKHVCSWPDAARKLSTMAAEMLGLSDRGRIADGCRADLVVLDPATLQDRATYQSPRRPPAGIQTVVVNGQVAVDEGRFTGAMGGSVLRRGN